MDLPKFQAPVKDATTIPVFPSAPPTKQYVPQYAGYPQHVEKPKFVEYVQTQVVPVVKHVPVPEVMNVPVPKPRQIPIEKSIDRNVPVPVDVVTNMKFSLPQLQPKYTTTKVKVVVPRYIEVAVPTHMVQVDEFEPVMVPGPPMKDFQWPQYAISDEQGDDVKSNTD